MTPRKNEPDELVLVFNQQDIFDTRLALNYFLTNAPSSCPPHESGRAQAEFKRIYETAHLLLRVLNEATIRSTVTLKIADHGVSSFYDKLFLPQSEHTREGVEL